MWKLVEIAQNLSAAKLEKIGRSDIVGVWKKQHIFTIGEEWYGNCSL